MACRDSTSDKLATLGVEEPNLWPSSRLELRLPRMRPQGIVAMPSGFGYDEWVAIVDKPGGLLRSRGPLRAAELGVPELVPLPDDPIDVVVVGERQLAVACRGTNELLWVDLDHSADVIVRRIGLPGVPSALTARSGLIAVALEDGRVGVVGEGSTLEFQSSGAERPTSLLLLAQGGLAVAFQHLREVHRFDSAQDLEQGPRQRFVLKGIPRHMVNVDLDGDGDDELAVAAGRDLVQIFGLRGDWQAPPVSVTVNLVPIRLVAYERGTSTELACLTHAGLTIDLLGDFASRPRVVDRIEGGQGPWSLARGDFDGDGRADFACANRDACVLSFVRGDAAGGVLREVRAETLQAPTSIACADLDGDGADEVLVASAAETSMGLFGMQDGAFEELRTETLPYVAPTVRAGDVDGDGDADVAALIHDGRSTSISLYTSNGSGELTLAVSLPVGSEIGDLALGDLDRDGRAEIVATDPAVQTVAVFRQGTTGWHAEPAQPVEGRPTAVDVRAGAITVALSDPPERRGIAWFDVTPDGLVERLHLPTERAGRDVEVADFDGDGQLDIAALTPGSTAVSPGWIVVWSGSSEGFQEPVTLSAGQRAFRLTTGDLDHDGLPDLACTAQFSHHLNVWLSRPGSGATGFRRLMDLGAGAGPLDVAIADVDGDGRAELVVANHFGHDLSIVKID